MASSSLGGTASSIGPDEYFAATAPPKDLEQTVAQSDDFIKHHAAQGRRVVLVTSGGTIVPLEKRTVRFIDNFSAGNRGAKSAEYFLEADYAVIFLHRQFSLQPYSRNYGHTTDCFLDFLVEGPGGSVVVEEKHVDKMVKILKKYREAKAKNLLLTLSFVTIDEYLHKLRAISCSMRALGTSGLLYLAAAVSDFFLPPDRISEHKIQSTNHAAGKASSVPVDASSQDEETFDNFDSIPKVPRHKQLLINLDPVPKFLKNVVDDWSPECMIISFKLETDPSILIDKAQYALGRYQHDLVIGNLLTTRESEVVLIAPGQQEAWIRLPSGGAGQPVEIESLIVPACVKKHDEHVSKPAADSSRRAAP